MKIFFESQGGKLNMGWLLNNIKGLLLFLLGMIMIL